MGEMMSYWNIFYQPIHRIGDKVDVAVTLFECESAEKVCELFYKSYVGVRILSTSAHYSRELAYKQIYDLSDLIHGHNDFHEPKMMCSKCRVNTISALTDDRVCNMCHFEMINSSKDVR